MMKVNNYSLKPQSGLSLLEILVTVVVLSIGLLGIAGMQAFGMRYNNDSYVRSQAISYANDLVERMHANPDAVNQGAYKSAINATTPTACLVANDPGAIVGTPDCRGVAVGSLCDTTEMANVDVFRMQCGYSDGTNLHTGVVNELPLGQLEIDCIDDASVVDTNPCTNDNSRTVRVSWQDPNDKDNLASRLQIEIDAQFL